MVVYIKNMVCLRCKMAVQSILDQLGFKYNSIQLGRADLEEEIDAEQQAKLNDLLKHFGLELMEDKKKILVELIKTLIIQLLHTPDNGPQVKLSAYLSKHLNHEYTYLSNTFSELEGSTIERFYIVNKIERVKELLLYEDLNITEIAFELNYSSVSHLCLQFKKVTGYTPSMFKKQCESKDYVWRTCE